MVQTGRILVSCCVIFEFLFFSYDYTEIKVFHRQFQREMGYKELSNKGLIKRFFEVFEDNDFAEAMWSKKSHDIKFFEGCKKEVKGINFITNGNIIMLCDIGTDCTFFYYSEQIGVEIMCNNCEAMMGLKELPKSYRETSHLLLTSLNPTKLPNTSIARYSSVQTLNVLDSQLDDINISQLPENITELNIRNNNLMDLIPEVLDFLQRRNGCVQIPLSENPWTCDCYGHFVEIVLIAVCVILIWFRTSILLWLYDHNIFVSCILSSAENIDFPQRFDGFLAFSHKNLDLVPEYVERLENGEREFKLCFYQRDWCIGQSISACILQSIEDSKRIIVLMTKEFVKSSWGTFEFRTAIKATSKNRNKALIIIVYPDVENFDELDLELKLYMKYHTYLRRDDPQFWRKLIYALPHKKVSKARKKAKPIDDPETEV